MSFKSQLTLGGKEYPILHFSYKLSQETDASGRPSSILGDGKLVFTVESTGDTNLAEFAMDSFERKDGKITFFKRDTDAKLKEIIFEEAYCIDYSESFEAYSTNPLTETFTLSARKLSAGSGEVEKGWE